LLRVKWEYSNYFVRVCSPCVNINAQLLKLSSQSLCRSRPPLLSIHPVFRLQVFSFECLLRENGLAIMTMTTFKVSTAALHLLAIACIMLVVVQVTEAARELDDGVGGVLVNGEQVASARTKAGLTVFQAAACELLRLPCAVQSSNGVNCIPRWGNCRRVPTDCCSGSCRWTEPYGFMCW
jgi:hypothetical protein